MDTLFYSWLIDKLSIMELIKLILNSYAGNFSKSTWKSISGVAVGVTLMLFITSKLDSFIINMEDYMLNFLPEIQLQRTKNAFPTSLKFNDTNDIKKLISGDNEVLISGSAFWDRGIFQIATKTTHINKDCLLFSGLIPKQSTVADNSNYLLNIKRYLQHSEPISNILAEGSHKIIISRRLELKLFGKQSAIGKELKLGLLKTKENKLALLTVAGIYNNNSVNAIFLSRSTAAQIMAKNKSKLNNAYIIRLKDKYSSKKWRKKLLNDLTNLRDSLKLQRDNLISTSGKTYEQLDFEYEKAKADVEFLSPFQIQSWMDISPENLEYLKITRIIMLLVFSSIIVLTGLSIKFLFDTIVIEKRRQIAILKVLGYTDLTVLRSFIMAGIFIGFSGVFIGITLGYLLNWTVGAFEQYYYEQYFSFQYINILPSISFTTKVALAVMLLCAASALPSARKVLKTRPIEGMKRDN